MFCPRCGKPVSPDAAFCSSCGAPLRAPAPAPVGSWPASSPSSTGAAPAATESGRAAASSVSSWAPGSAPTAATSYGEAPVVVVVPVATLRYAGFWIRVLASLIDGVIFMPLSWAMDRIMGVNPAAPFSPASGASLFFQSIAWLAYGALLESSSWQGTVGKLVVGIRVTDLEGRRISVLRAGARNLAMYLSFLLLGIGFLMVAFHERKQGLHDMIAGTLVLRGRRAA